MSFCLFMAMISCLFGSPGWALFWIVIHCLTDD
jgi:hypothetical protein